MPPPVVDIRPRVLPRAIGGEGGLEGIQAAADAFLQVSERRRDRQLRRDLERLRGDIQGTLQEGRLAAQERLSGTFEERAQQELERIRAQAREQRGTIGFEFGLDAPFREQELDLRGRGLDIQEQLGLLDNETRRAIGLGQIQQRDLESLRRFNIGLADINQRNQLARAGFGIGGRRGSLFPLQSLATTLGGQFDIGGGFGRDITREDIIGLGEIARGNFDRGASLLFPSQNRGRDQSVTDRPPGGAANRLFGRQPTEVTGQPGLTIGDAGVPQPSPEAERLRGGGRSLPEGGVGIAPEDVGLGVNPQEVLGLPPASVPLDAATPDQHATFIQNFLDEEEGAAFLEALQPEQRREVEEILERRQRGVR